MLTTQQPLSAKVKANFADKRLQFGIVRSRTKATKFVCLFVKVTKKALQVGGGLEYFS
jgi:hypothetical protein